VLGDGSPRLVFRVYRASPPPGTYSLSPERSVHIRGQNDFLGLSLLGLLMITATATTTTTATMMAMINADVLMWIAARPLDNLNARTLQSMSSCSMCRWRVYAVWGVSERTSGNRVNQTTRQ
jgi:hypothetical protein